MRNLELQSDVYFNTLENELYAINTLTGAIIHINATGAFVWNGIFASNQEEQIINNLNEIYPNENIEVIEQDVKNFIDRLISMNFITPFEFDTR